MGADGRFHAQFSAVEEDANAEVRKVSKPFAASLNTAVETFARGVGNEVLEVVEDVWQEAFEQQYAIVLT